jgi:hypothetical protein
MRKHIVPGGLIGILAAFLLSVVITSCQAQTTHTTHTPAVQSDSRSGVIYTTSPTTSVTLPSGTSWTGVSYQTAGGTATWDGTTWLQCTSGYCYTTNGQEAERRPFDHKGPTLAQVDGSAVELKQVDIPSATYIALAKEVKLDAASEDEAEMLNTIFDHEFHVYNFDKVDNYLYRQALEKGVQMKWGWKPLRSEDLNVLADMGSAMLPADNGVVFKKQYARRVPARILEDVRCVRAEMANAVFLVSDFEHVTPDPFLAISTPKLLQQGKLWIVDRWDEPTFDDHRPVKARLESRTKE